MSISIQIPIHEPVVTSNIQITSEVDKPFIIIAGQNGCGKSTLFRLFLGLLGGNSKPTINFREKIFYPSENRGIVRYLPQVPENGLFSRLSVKDNVKLLQDLLCIESCDIGEDFKKDYNIPAWCLSVGRQKMLLLKAILNSIPSKESSYLEKNPMIILLDEPFAGLDSGKQQVACDLINSEATKYSDAQSVVFIIIDHSNIEPIAPGATHTSTIRYEVNFNYTAASSIKLRKTI